MCRRSKRAAATCSGRRTTNCPITGPTASSSRTGWSSARPRRRPSRSTRKPARSSGRCRWCATNRRASTWPPATTTASSTSRPCRSTLANSTAPAGSGSSGRWKPRPARNCGTSTPSRRTSGANRRSTRAAVSGTRRPSTARARCTSASATRRRSRGPKKTVGIEPARAEPVHRRPGQARRKERQARVVLPGHPARPLRLGLPEPPILVEAGGRNWCWARASRAASSRSTRRAASRSGRNRSASTTATTTTGCWRCAAKPSKLKPPMLVYPGSLGGVIAPMATDGKSVFVPVINAPLEVTSGPNARNRGRSAANWSRSTSRPAR